MCFHAKQTKSVLKLENRYNVNLYNSDARDAFDVSFYHINGFTHPNMLVIPQQDTSKLIISKWGIIPSNTKPDNISDYYKKSIRFGGGLNAQSEKIFEHFIYKQSINEKRCIVPLDGFYEPHTLPNNKKIPFHFKRKDDGIISLAGIYTVLEGGLTTFTIFTKQASPLFAKIHNKKNRQPVILNDDIVNEWLSDDLNENGIKELINLKYDDEALDTYPISKDLFSPKVDSNRFDIANKVEYSELEILL